MKNRSSYFTDVSKTLLFVATQIVFLKYLNHSEKIKHS